MWFLNERKIGEKNYEIVNSSLFKVIAGGFEFHIVYLK
jgi:hypothetical protein